MADSKAETVRKLTQLEAKILKVLIQESDPDNWAGRGRTSFDLKDSVKTARLVDKSQAKATYAVLKAIKDTRKEITAPLKKGEVFKDVVDENQEIAELNQIAESKFKHLMSIN